MSEKKNKPPDWVVIPIKALNDERVDYDMDRLEEMASILTQIMYILMDAEKSTGYSEEN